MNKKIINPFACFGFKEQPYFDSFYNNQNKECNDVSGELGEIKDKVANNEKKNTDQDKEIQEIKDANTNFKVEISEEAGTSNILKTYVVKQGGEEIGKINIPTDSFIESGKYDKDNNILTLKLKNGTEVPVDLADLINDVDLVNKTIFDEYKKEVEKQLKTKQVAGEYATKVELDKKANKSDIPTDFYSKQEVDNKIDSNKSAIDGINTALNNKADKSNVETNTSDITNIKDNYVKKEELGSKQDVISDLNDIREGASKGATALQEVPVEYAKKSDIPTKTSDLTNDSGFLTSHQSLDGYAKSVDVNAGLEKKLDASAYKPYDDTQIKADIAANTNAIASKQDKGDYALKNDIPTKTSDLTNDSGFLTEHQNISNLATKDELAKKLDASAYKPYDDSQLKSDIAKKQDVISDLDTIRSDAKKGTTALQSVPDGYAKTSDIPTKTSDLTNDSKFISLGGINEVGTAMVEKLTFTLENGNVVTKNILILNQTN